MIKRNNESIYKTYIFKNKTSQQLILKLSMIGTSNPYNVIEQKIKELTEKYCIPAGEIVVE